MGELLISKGADINAKDIIHQYIIYLSFLIIMNQMKEKNLNKNNNTPLHIALENKLDKKTIFDNLRNMLCIHICSF